MRHIERGELRAPLARELSPVLHCEGPQVRHVAARHHHVADKVLQQILEARNRLLPAALLVRQAADQLLSAKIFYWD